MIKNILSQQAFWSVNKAIAKVVGLEAALLLSELVDKYSYYESRGELVKRGNDLFFFATAESIETNTTLTYREQKAAIAKLQENSMINTVLMGVPAKLHFSICSNEIIGFLGDKNAKQDCTNVQNKFLQKRNTGIADLSKQEHTKTQNKIVQNGETIIKNRIIKNKELKIEIECESAHTNFSSNLNLSSKKNNRKAEVTIKENHTGPAESNKTGNENILFKNSIYANNFELFKNDLIFKNKENEMYDLRYYFDTVQDWSESKGEKRANWIATAQRFIARDNDSKKAKFSSNAINKNDNKPIPTATKRGNIVEF